MSRRLIDRWASERHSERITKLKRKKSAYEQEHAEMLGLKENEDIEDDKELEISIAGAKQAAETVGKQLAKAETQAPTDDVMQASWQNFQAHFYEVCGRIRCFHERVAQHALDQIAWIHAEPVRVPNFCYRCGSDNGSQSAPGSLIIHFKSEALQRANALAIGTPDGLSHVALAERSVADLRVALEEIDLSQLGPYEKPIVEATSIAQPLVHAWKPPVSARPQPQPTALKYPDPKSQNLGGMMASPPCGHHWRASGLGVRADVITPSLAAGDFCSKPSDGL